MKADVMQLAGLPAAGNPAFFLRKGGPDRMNRFIIKHPAAPVWVVIMVLVLLPLPASGQTQEMAAIQQAQSIRQLFSIYSNTDNAYVRRQAMQSVSRLAPSAEDSQTVAMLEKGLQDTDIGVVQETIRQIGLLRADAFAETLEQIFSRCDALYPGSQKQVQAQIITALGKIGGAPARSVFRQVLADGAANYRTTRTLNAIAELNDPALIAEVTSYADRIQATLATMDTSPQNRFRYQRYQQALEHARVVQQQLSQL
jgi:hypothetical protein